MERTSKPWDKNQEQHGRPRGLRKNHVKETTLRDKMMHSLDIPAHKRNPQRDAIKPPAGKISRLKESSSSSNQVQRPVSAPPSSSRPNLPTQDSQTTRNAERPPLVSAHSQNPSLSTSRPYSTHSYTSNPTCAAPDTALLIAGDEPPPAYEVTEWTEFVDRIQREPSSTTYEDLLLLEEVNGTATTSSQGGANDQDKPLNASVGPIELLHRRTTKDGKTKLKLGLVGVRVDCCGICLAQFRVDESGALTDCQHSFHKTCLRRWAIRSASCPVCRVTLAHT